MSITIQQLLEGVSAETATQVEATIKANATKLNAKVFIDGDGEHFVPAARLSEVTTERNQLKETLTSQAEQIKTLDNLTKDNSEAQSTIATLNTQLQNQSALTKRAAITAQLASNVTDSVAPASDLLDFLNIDEVQVKDDGSIIGLDEQVSKVRESRKYLFKEATGGTPPPASKGTGDPGTGGAAGGAAGSNQKEVGSLGKMLAEQTAKSQASTESNFWK